MKRGRTKGGFLLSVAAILFACLTVAGSAYDLTDQSLLPERILARPNTFLILLVVCAGFFYAGLRALFRWVDRYDRKEMSEPEADGRLRVRWKGWMTATVPLLVCWSPYLILTYPGTIGGMDYFWQILQGGGALPLSNHHPVFGSFVFYGLYHLGYRVNGAAGGVFITCLVQMITMASVMGYCVTVLSEQGLPRWARRVVIAFFCLCPIFPAHAIIAVKDSFFSDAAVMFFFSCFLQVWCERESLRPPVPSRLPCLVL